MSLDTRFKIVLITCVKNCANNLLSSVFTTADLVAMQIHHHALARFFERD